MLYKMLNWFKKQFVLNKKDNKKPFNNDNPFLIL
jgi:hypothetical protein